MTIQEDRERFGKMLGDGLKACNVRTADQIDMSLRYAVAMLLATAKPEHPNAHLREVLHQSVDRLFAGMTESVVRRTSGTELIHHPYQPEVAAGDPSDDAFEVASVIGNDLEELTLALESMVFPGRGPEALMVNDPARDAIQWALVQLFRDHGRAAQGVIDGMASLRVDETAIHRPMN